ncbi:hypothetical protein DFJ74DRAFT_749339, partial [Hyaloraphidium curvatum]
SAGAPARTAAACLRPTSARRTTGRPWTAPDSASSFAPTARAPRTRPSAACCPSPATCPSPRTPRSRCRPHSPPRPRGTATPASRSALPLECSTPRSANVSAASGARWWAARTTPSRTPASPGAPTESCRMLRCGANCINTRMISRSPSSHVADRSRGSSSQAWRAEIESSSAPVALRDNKPPPNRASIPLPVVAFSQMDAAAANPKEPQALGGMFSAAELLALLPTPAALQPPLAPELASLVPMESDPAADFRAADPMTRARLLAALAPLRVPFALVAAQAWPRLNRLPVSRTLFFLLPVAVAAPYAAWGPALASGAFSARGAAVGVAAFAFECAAFHVVLLAQRVPAWGRPPTEDASPWCGLARWIELSGWGTAQAGDAEAPAERGPRPRPMLEHRDRDPWCPCARSSCAGGLPRRSSAIQLARQIVTNILAQLVYWLFASWTPTVFLGDAIWGVPWKAALFSYLPVVYVVQHVSIILEGISTDVALLELEGRLEARAIAMSLSEVVQFCVADADAQEGEPVLTTDSQTQGQRNGTWETYIELHHTLAPKWRARAKASQDYNLAHAAVFGLSVVVLLVFMFGSGCATAWIIGSLALHTLELLFALLNFATANGIVARNAALYGRAAADIRLAFAGRRLPVSTAAAAQVAVLERFERAVDENLARLFGVPVTFGFVRGIAATLVTIAVGLVGILRGAGVRATMQSWCTIE